MEFWRVGILRREQAINSLGVDLPEPLAPSAGGGVRAKIEAHAFQHSFAREAEGELFYSEHVQFILRFSRLS